MEHTRNIEHLLEEANKLIETGKVTDDVRRTLGASGVDSETIEIIIHQLRSQQFLKRRKRGFLLGAIGSVMLLVGFILTVIFFHAGISFQYVMYGMTSIGVLLLIAGMVEVVGW